MKSSLKPSFTEMIMIMMTAYVRPNFSQMKVGPVWTQDIQDGCEGVCARKDFAGGYGWVAGWKALPDERAVEEELNDEPLTAMVAMVADEWMDKGAKTCECMRR